ncbi:hypothetical protein SAMN04487772_1293 [[Clostridium] polysaccharolyticum]|uniref:Uncharacterized protein n=2 Tax=[Clostridium] polysaccharolyticum TaxID=29364 RepID=A0A1I0FBN7_9FIRM|nr:hypothetical protein SAMN04487772_1293 [[Clostridium] polysaccharolyticum]
MRKNDFDNIKLLAKEIMREPSNKVPIQSFINSIGYSVVQQEFMKLIKGERIETTPTSLFEDIGIFLKPGFGTDKVVSISKDERTLFPISLTNNLVIPLAWNENRFTSCITNIGSDANNPFAYDLMNHFSYLILPLNIVIMHNGNHSILTGILKREGTIFPTEVADLTDMYKEGIKFNGQYYIDRDGTKLKKAQYSELGVLFEIGRMLNEQNISFLTQEQQDMINQKRKSI